MGEFSNFKDFLIKFDYPNVNFMDDDKIDEIFSVQNRPFLFKWLMNHINSQYQLSPQWSKVAQIVLADFFSQSGFCLPTEKLDFVQKSDTLSKKQEVEIFQRIFEFSQNSQARDEKDESRNNILELDVFVKTDVNLFPTLGEIKLRSCEKKNERLEYLNSQIDILKQELENYTEGDLKSDDCWSWSPDETKRKLENFCSNILKLRQVCSNNSCTSDSDSFIKDSKFKQELGDQLTICSSKTNEVVKYFRNIKETEISEFQSSQDYKSLEQDEVFKLAQQLSVNSTKIVESK